MDAAPTIAIGVSLLQASDFTGGRFPLAISAILENSRYSQFSGQTPSVSSKFSNHD